MLMCRPLRVLHPRMLVKLGAWGKHCSKGAREHNLHLRTRRSVIRIIDSSMQAGVGDNTGQMVRFGHTDCAVRRSLRVSYRVADMYLSLLLWR